ncbi:MAG: COG1361 S-layer family protein [Halobacteria archaeon]|nr:COG1361 S-layer family protein [Halobacteria archaeon]
MSVSMSASRSLWIALAVVAGVTTPVSVYTASAADTVVGGPAIEVLAPHNTVSAGETTTLGLHLNNEGNIVQGGPAEYESRVTTARGVTVELRSRNAPVEIKTSKTPVGSVSEGSHGPYSFEVVVDDDAEPGRYRLPVEVEYRFTRAVEYSDVASPDYTDFSRDLTKYVTLVVEPSAEFEVTRVESDVEVGGAGSLTVGIKNVGSETANASTVRLTSRNTEVRVGDVSSASTSVSASTPTLTPTLTSTTKFTGDWEPGETRRLRQTVSVADNVVATNYSLNAVVRYTDSDGQNFTSDRLELGLQPLRETAFEISDVTTSLRVGEEGFLEATVENTGARVARDAVVVLRQTSVPLVGYNSTSSEAYASHRDVSLSSTPTASVTQYPLGDLRPNTSQSFRLRLDVPEHAAPGRHRFRVGVEYTDRLGNVETSDSHEASAEVLPDTDDFVIESEDTTVEVGEETSVNATITNLRNSTFTDVTASLTVEEPFSTDDTNSYVAALDPGDKSSLRYHLDVSDDAVAGDKYVTVRLGYDDPKGDRRTETHTFRVTLRDETTEADLPAVVLIGTAALVFVVWWWRRR